MTPKRKKYITFVAIAFFFFFSGVEYAVILPTAWLYLHERFHAEPYMLGVLLSSFCLSSMIAGPIMGRWADQMKRTKVVILFANLWQVAGSLMYWFGYGAWFLVAGRFVAGIGTGMGPVLLADIARVTAAEKRTAALSVFMAVAQLGLLVGPGCNLFLRKLDFNIGTFKVDKFTSPGLFMALLWTIYEVIIVFFYWELPEIHKQMQGAFLSAQIDDSYHRNTAAAGGLDATTPSSMLQDTETIPSIDAYSADSIDTLESPNTSPFKNPPPPRLRSPPISATLNHANLDVIMTSSNEMIESAERFMSTPEPSDESPTHPASNDLYFENAHFAQHEAPCDYSENARRVTGGSDARSHYSSAGPTDEPKIMQPPALWSTRFYVDEYMREEIVTLLAAVFMSFFVQIALETLLTPLANSLMDWEELQISYLYIGCSVEVLTVFAILNVLSKKVSDRILILFGFLCEVATLAYLMWYLPTAPKHNEAHNLPYLLVGLFFNILGLPFLMVCSNSLYTKLTKKETQGFSQGLRRFAGGLGNLLAPLWAGSLVNDLRTMTAVLLSMISLATVLVIVTFKKLKPKDDKSNQKPNIRTVPTINATERTPLLSGRRS